MRVVLLEPDGALRAKLRGIVDEHRPFVVIGESEDWDTCASLLEQFVPELLIARLADIPSRVIITIMRSEFPVLLALLSTNERADRYFSETMPLLSASEQLAESLVRCRTEIYKRKATGLATLLDRYLASVFTVPQYLSSISVDKHGSSLNLPIDDVVLFSAYGNYVRVTTLDNTYEIRETMSGITGRLDPTRFARVHRCFIVNRSYVRSLRQREGAATCVSLANGTEVPIGPHFKEELNRISLDVRLSA